MSYSKGLLPPVRKGRFAPPVVLVGTAPAAQRSPVSWGAGSECILMKLEVTLGPRLWERTFRGGGYPGCLHSGGGGQFLAFSAVGQSCSVLICSQLPPLRSDHEVHSGNFTECSLRAGPEGPAETRPLVCPTWAGKAAVSSAMQLGRDPVPATWHLGTSKRICSQITPHVPHEFLFHTSLNFFTCSNMHIIFLYVGTIEKLNF